MSQSKRMYSLFTIFDISTFRSNLIELVENLLDDLNDGLEVDRAVTAASSNNFELRPSSISVLLRLRFWLGWLRLGLRFRIWIWFRLGFRLRLRLGLRLRLWLGLRLRLWFWFGFRCVVSVGFAGGLLVQL